MKHDDLVVFALQWLGEHAPALTALLLAASPLLAVGVVGYALHVVQSNLSKKKR